MSVKYPWFPFFAADFLTDEKTLAMSYREIGIYIVLLSHQWIQGSIPADPSRAQAMLKLGSSEAGEDEDYAALQRVVADCFVPHNGLPGRLINQKLAEIQEAQDQRRSRLSEAGRRGGEHTQAKLKPGLSQPQANKREREKEIKELLDVPLNGAEKRQSKPRTTGTTWLTPFGEDWKQELSGVPNYKAMAKPFEQLLTIHTVEEIRPVWRAYLRGTKGQPYPVQPQRFCENFGKYAEHIRPLTPEEAVAWVAANPVR